MRKIGILGGSFDPIHIGHTAIVEAAMKQLALDHFMIIPTKYNPWKETSYTSTKERLTMLDIAIAPLENVEVNRIEIESEKHEKNYTIDTIKALKKKYPNDTLYFIMGMDQASQFNKWKDAKEIAELVHLVVFNRIGYSPNENLVHYHFITLEHVASDISSTAIRNGEIQFLDKKVLQYIVMHGLYLESIIASKMSKQRFIHTNSMAKLASEIATVNGLNKTKAYVAGMLHDIAKEMPEEEAREIMKTHFMNYIDKPFPVWHQWISAHIANTIYQVEDPEILQAIRHHTTASIQMAKLDMCIYVADKYDPSRGYDSSQGIALCKQDIVKGFKQCILDVYAFSKKENREIDSVYNKYCKGDTK